MSHLTCGGSPHRSILRTVRNCPLLVLSKNISGEVGSDGRDTSCGRNGSRGIDGLESYFALIRRDLERSVPEGVI